MSASPSSATGRPTRPDPVPSLGDAPSNGWTALPLVRSRALGRLLRLESLHFNVESSQPVGSWLDRSAEVLASTALGEGRTGLCVVGIDAWTIPLAVQCVRAGLRLVILESTDGDGGAGGQAHARPGDRAWLGAFGARVIAVDADSASVRQAAPSAAHGAGLRLIEADEPLLGTGLLEVVGEVHAAGHGDALLAVPSVTGQEPGWLAAAARLRLGAVPLPLNGLAPPAPNRPAALVGALAPPPGPDSAGAGHDAATLQDDAILSVGVSLREAEAARRLLAREEGLVVSHRGAVGFAALVRALREDRARRPRERRLRGLNAAVVLVAGAPVQSGDGPTLASDAVPGRPVSLAALSADLARLLVEPPGR